jgi:prolyl-tRNA synthetase
VIGDRGLKENNVEYQGRKDTAAQVVPLQDVKKLVQSKL